MEEEFARTALLVGAEKVQALQQKTVMVFGVGGVGSHCIEALARGGVRRLILVDHDRVERSNINRQSIASSSTLGRLKVDVMRERLTDICPDIQVETQAVFVGPDNVAPLMEARPDYVVDAIDTVTGKLAIIEAADREQIPVISSMGTGNKLHGECFEIADLSETSVCPLCRVMRRELKKRGIEHVKVLYSKEKPLTPVGEATREGKPVPGSVSFVPPVAGYLIAGEVIRDLWEV